MKFIITEKQEEYLERWSKFQRFMMRRDTEIKELISIYSKRPRTNPAMVLENVLVKLANDNYIDSEGELFQWLYHYLRDNYRDYVKQEFEK